MATYSYVNANGVTLSTISNGHVPQHSLWAAAPGRTNGGLDGGHTLVADGADDLLYIYSVSDKVIVPGGARGISTVVDGAWNASYTLAAGIQNVVLAGGSQIVTGNSMDNLIVARTGDAVMSGGGGNDVFVCGSGHDTIIDPPGAGDAAIYHFGHGNDVVRLDHNTNFADFAAVKAAMRQVGSDVRLSLGGGQTLTFDGARIADFSAADFFLPINTAALKLTFDDEFNRLSASPDGRGTTWRSTLGHGARSLPANHEWEYYSDNSVGRSPFSTSNGTLTITASPTNPAADALHLPYTSGAITTERSYSQLYGYFEMRAQLPAGQGFWPAFWLLPANGKWPPELDVMEQIGSQPGTDVVSVHSEASGHHTAVRTNITVPDTTRGFHTYGVDWESDYVRFFFDGQQIARVATPSDMHTPMYMLANLAVGGPGSWPGKPAPGATAQMKIDYIRAYSVNGSGRPTPSPAPTPPEASPPTPNPAPPATPAPAPDPAPDPGVAKAVFTLTRSADAFNGTAADDRFVATRGAVGAGDVLNGNGGDDTLVLQGGGKFDLNSLRGFTGIEAVSLQEGVGAAAQVVALRNYVDVTANVASAANGGITIHTGANRNIVNLGRGKDVVYVEGAGVTVNGHGQDVFYADADKLGAKLDGGGEGSKLFVTSSGQAILGGNISGIGAVALLAAGTVLDAGAMAKLEITGSSGGDDTIRLGDASQYVTGGGADELVLASAAHAGAAVAGLGAGSTLEITTGGTVALNPHTGGADAAHALTVQLDAATHLTLSPIAFLQVQGSAAADTIVAAARGQVISGGGGSDTLVGFSGGGDVFRDSTAALNGDTIRGLVGGDSIDLTDMAFSHAAVTYGTGSATLTVGDGYHAAAIHLAGRVNANGFSLGDDGHGGSVVRYHG